MKARSVLLSLCLLSTAVALHSLEFEVGAAPWMRIEKSSSTAMAAPGGELYLELMLWPQRSIRISGFAGQWFGTAAGGDISYLFSWQKNSWCPQAGIGVFAGYKDVLFYTTSSYDYVIPNTISSGMSVHLRPFRWDLNRAHFSISAVSVGCDFLSGFRAWELDIHIVEFGLTFGGNK